MLPCTHVIDEMTVLVFIVCMVDFETTQIQVTIF